MVGVGVMLWLRSEPTRALAGWSFITSDDVESGRPGVWRSALHPRHTEHVARRAAHRRAAGTGHRDFPGRVVPAAVAHASSAFMVELLAAIPSVVYGAWGIFVFIPQFVTPLGNWLMNTLGTPGMPIPAHLSRARSLARAPWPPG